MKISRTSRPGSNGRNGKTPRSEPRDLRRSLSPKFLSQAKQIAQRYTVVLQPNPRLGFRGSAVEFPTVFTHGKTVEECVRKTREALMVGVAVMLEAGQAPPVPASEEMRDQQLNIRLSAHEKMVIESAAKRRGFRGISDFVRTAALAETRKSA